MARKNPVAFEFVLEQLDRINPVVKPMFGCHALYRDDQIVMILRDRESHPRDNGVWLATTAEHHASLKEIFPSLRSIGLLGTGDTAWQNLPADADDFEASVMQACELILNRDGRIGKVPSPKRKKTPIRKR